MSLSTLTLLSSSGRTRCFAAELIPCALEVETCTWRVLPEILRPQKERDLVACLTGELAWLEMEMDHRHNVYRP